MASESFNWTLEEDDESVQMENNKEILVSDDRSLLTTTFISASFMAALCLVGLYGNVMSAIVFMHRSMKAPINVLLMALSLVDFTLLFLAIPVFILPSFNVLFGDATLRRLYQFSSLGLYPLNMAAHTSSVWTFVLISVERYLAVCQPLNRHKLLTYREAKFAQIVVIVSALFYNLVRFWEHKPTAERTGIAALLRDNAFYFIFYYTTLYILTQFLAPFTIILILNFAIVRSLRRSSSSSACSEPTVSAAINLVSLMKGKKLSVTSQNQFDVGHRQVGPNLRVHQQQRRVTVMIVVITFMFAGCNALAIALNIYESLDPMLFNGPSRSLAYLTLDVSNFLIFFNSSSTFLVYIIFLKKYRTLFLAYAKLGCCLRSGRLMLRRAAERRRATSTTFFGTAHPTSGYFQIHSTMGDRKASNRDHTPCQEAVQFIQRKQAAVQVPKATLLLVNDVSGDANTNEQATDNE